MQIMQQIVREGDVVQRMLFIVRGHLRCSQALRNGATSSCTLGPGNFSGDELLSWCLRRPFLERLPASSSTLATLESTEAFGLDAADVRYVTRHFRYTLPTTGCGAARATTRPGGGRGRPWPCSSRGEGTSTARHSRRCPSSARGGRCRGARRWGRRSSATVTIQFLKFK